MDYPTFLEWLETINQLSIHNLIHKLFFFFFGGDNLISTTHPFVFCLSNPINFEGIEDDFFFFSFLEVGN